MGIRISGVRKFQELYSISLYTWLQCKFLKDPIINSLKKSKVGFRSSYQSWIVAFGSPEIFICLICSLFSVHKMLFCFSNKFSFGSYFLQEAKVVNIFSFYTPKYLSSIMLWRLESTKSLKRAYGLPLAEWLTVHKTVLNWSRNRSNLGWLKHRMYVGEKMTISMRKWWHKI